MMMIYLEFLFMDFSKFGRDVVDIALDSTSKNQNELAMMTIPNVRLKSPLAQVDQKLCDLVISEIGDNLTWW